MIFNAGWYYRRWLSTLAFEHPAQQIAFQDYVDAVMDAERRLQRVEEQISKLLPDGIGARLSTPCRQCGA